MAREKTIKGKMKDVNLLHGKKVSTKRCEKGRRSAFCPAVASALDVVELLGSRAGATGDESGSGAARDEVAIGSVG